MIAIEQARAHLETLGLSQAVEVLDRGWTPPPGSSFRTLRCSQTSWEPRSPPAESAT